MLNKIKNHQLLLELLLVSIITIPAFISLFYGSYFTMHDDQHIARLFLLDLGISQGSLYPRWVDGLGFGYGYPLFNFYPPFIYYIAEIFHLIGFSLINSIKLMIVTGFVGAAMGMYLFAKNIMGKAAALVASVLYTYFFYHAITVFVRGAFAEFFTFAILPFILLFLHLLFKKSTVKNALGLGISFAALILTHPLIAFPAMIYIGFFVAYYFILNLFQDPVVIPAKAGIYLNRFRVFARNDKFTIRTGAGLLLGLGLSAFFWLPSMMERKFTMVDSILLKELASYKIHFIELQQLWYSPWGYGGSIAGTGDGFTFQLGKIHILLFAISLVLFFIYWLKTKKIDLFSKHYLLFAILLFFSVLMSIPASRIVWDNVHFLWYLQFPWRFLTFAAVFISLCSGYVVFFASHIDKKRLNKEWILLTASLGISLVTIWKYHHYFRPQKYLTVTDQTRTTDDEIKWRISKSSFEFVPKGVKTTKSEFGTTILDIKKENVAKKPFIENQLLNVKVVKNEFAQKWFVIKAQKDTYFQLAVYNFPGWKAYKSSQSIFINDNNSLRLITVKVPEGENYFKFNFEDTPVRKIANIISFGSILLICSFLVKIKVRKH